VTRLLELKITPTTTFKQFERLVDVLVVAHDYDGSKSISRKEFRGIVVELLAMIQPECKMEDPPASQIFSISKEQIALIERAANDPNYVALFKSEDDEAGLDKVHYWLRTHVFEFLCLRDEDIEGRIDITLKQWNDESDQIREFCKFKRSLPPELDDFRQELRYNYSEGK
jgi:hypothetical protein